MTTDLETHLLIYHEKIKRWLSLCSWTNFLKPKPKYGMRRSSRKSTTMNTQWTGMCHCVKERWTMPWWLAARLNTKNFFVCVCVCVFVCVCSSRHSIATLSFVIFRFTQKGLSILVLFATPQDVDRHRLQFRWSHEPWQEFGRPLRIYGHRPGDNRMAW